jgi:hypothetical protein
MQSSTKTQENSWKCNSYCTTQSTPTYGANHTPKNSAQGIPGTKGTGTIVFIKYDEIPLDQRWNITYGKTVVTYWPEKDNPNQTRLTVGGN